MTYDKSDVLDKMIAEIFVDALIDAIIEDEKRRAEVKKDRVVEDKPKRTSNTASWEFSTCKPESFPDSTKSKLKAEKDALSAKYGEKVFDSIDLHLETLMSDPLTFYNVMDALARGAVRKGYYTIPSKPSKHPSAKSVDPFEKSKEQFRKDKEDWIKKNSFRYNPVDF